MLQVGKALLLGRKSGLQSTVLESPSPPDKIPLRPATVIYLRVGTVAPEPAKCAHRHEHDRLPGALSVCALTWFSYNTVPQGTPRLTSIWAGRCVLLQLIGI